MASTRGTGGRSSESAIQHSSRRTTRTDAVKVMRGGKVGAVRGLTRSATIQNKSGNGGDRPEHPLSSISRLTAEEAAVAAGGDALGPAAARVGAGAGAGGAEGGHRRMVSDMASSQSDHGTDRRVSHARDPLRRSGDTAASDTPSMAERGGHGRDGPVYPRDSVAAGGNSTRPGGAAVERERTTTSGSGYKVGEEELPMEVPGRYEKMRVLGRGSFGAVTLVKDHRDSKLYAMKTLNCADKLEERETAMAEVRLLKWLKHPCVLTLFDVFLSADSRLVCLTTTYCESGDLAKIVKHAAKTKSLLGEKTVLGWFAQLCLGVHNLHEEKRVLHRDIKPNNVFLMDSKKIIQLGDFGLAKVINDGDKQVKAEVGTPYYTSPEMCNNQPYGFPSDVWSLGIVLYELLSLDVPFRSRDVVALVSQVIKAPPPPLPEIYSDEVTALTRWMLQKDPLRRPTLTQALACQPLRRHMSSFVKHYRPMNMAERQRRHDIKDLEAQVSAIIEHGGNDPQIPADVNEGCGTHPTGASTQDDPADCSNRADSKSQSLEARGGGGGGGGGEEVEGCIAIVGASGDPRGIGGADAAARTKTADRSAVRSPSTAGFIAVITDGEDFTAAGAAGCTRCGAQVPCACGGGGGGARGGGGGGAGGATGGGGNTTPGRRFGSPQQSKGLRNVMSWAPGGSISASTAKGRDSGVGDGDGVGKRRGRSSGYGENDADRNSSSSGGSVGSMSSEESFNQPSSPHGSQRRERRKSGGEERGTADGVRVGRLSGEGGARKRSRGVGLRESQGEDGSGSATDQGAGSGGSKDNGGTAPERPKSPRSPRSHSSTRLKRVSGGGSSRGNGSIDGDDSDGERTTVTTLTISNRYPSLGRDGRGTGNRSGDDDDDDEEGDGHRPARNQPPRAGDDTAPSGEPSTGLIGVSRQRAEQPAACSRQETTADNDRPTASPAVSLTGSRRSSLAAPAGGETQVSGGNAISPRRRSSAAAPAMTMPASASGAAAIAAAPAGAGGPLVLDHPAATPRTPRSPRLVGSGSETFKTAKRLSEALTFAASGGEEEGPLTNAASSGAGRVGFTPRRESAALGGALAAVEEAAAEANGAHRGVPLGGRQPAEARDAAAVFVRPSPAVDSGGVP